MICFHDRRKYIFSSYKYFQRAKCWYREKYRVQCRPRQVQNTKDEVVATGYLVLQTDEVKQIITELISHNLSVTALQSHMLQETPRLGFLHFCGKDKPETLAQLLKTALNKTNSIT